MVIIAVPFGFGSVRSSSGKNITAAALAGLLLYLGTEISGNAGSLQQINPLFLTLTPVAIILLAAIVLIRRVH